VFVIGGGQIYSQLLEKADELYLTLVEKNYDGDTLFPPYEHLLDAKFRMTNREVHDGYTFVDYERGEVSRRTSAFRTVVLAGLLAGTLDGIAASVKFIIATGRNPIRVFVFIASGVFGEDAFSAGNLVALWGVAFHYVIALGWALIFFLLYPRIKFLSRAKIISGVAYGFVVWVIMNSLVVPLSNTPPLPFDLGNAILAVIILMVCVGLPISLVVGRHFSRKASELP
ncbi:MAG: dihydrofolate reductase, partial [Ignavibacteriae bacterium]|nr:dihydrofolate reductase [Ignavibacteriota bacterium]